ncbi:MAG: AGE family epimerase/isomerase [Spirochaetales bacterium]|nr:AGE family epimerase/isomerase [Spirochaetales bacterium]
MSFQDPWNFSDIFVSRGLFAEYLISGKSELQLSAIEYIQNIFLGVKEGKFVTDQLSFAVGNPVGAVRGRLSHTPWMILIGSMTLLLKHNVSDALELGIYIIRYILDNHVNMNGKWPNLKEYDYVEFINSNGDLWYTDGVVLSDPGHSLEFVGLASRFLSAAKSKNLWKLKKKQELEEITFVLFSVFHRNFTNGFNYESGGIVKLKDLITHSWLNREMPWWPLPETMRAALGCYEIVQNDIDKAFCMESYSLCHNSFFGHYITDNSPGMLAIQTRNSKGNTIDSIPAVPDADPGYHTGLALIDCIELINKITEKSKI